MIEGEVFKKIDFTSQKLKIDSFEACRFESCNLEGAHLSGIKFIECEFMDCNLTNAHLKTTTLNEVVFTDCKMMGILFGDINPFLLDVTFNTCQLSLCSFYGLNLKNTAFTDRNLKDADFTDTDLTNCLFERCDLNGAHFERSNLQKADLRTAENYTIDPENNKLKGVLISLDGARGLLSKYGVKIS
jgi:uncharacterized protein YjbI with pentapeptide repeats